MTTSKVRTFARFITLSALGLAATALAPTSASAAANCLQPESVPYSLTQPLTALQRAKHHAAIVACQYRQEQTQQSMPVGRSALDGPAALSQHHARNLR